MPSSLDSVAKETYVCMSKSHVIDPQKPGERPRKETPNRNLGHLQSDTPEHSGRAVVTAQWRERDLEKRPRKET